MKKKTDRLSSGTIVVFLLILPLLFISCERGEKASDKNRGGTPVTGPIIDTNTGAGGVIDRLNIDNKSPEAIAAAADRYFESGNYLQAIDLYKKAIELKPQDVDAYNDLGLSLHYIRRSNEAIDILQKGTKINPRYQNIWLSLGFVLAQSGRNDEAKIVLKQAQDINPETPQGVEAKSLLQMLK
ncbi:MAG: tetratricopeptide repeat protein [Nitrospirae bacterium]|nr:tetratricopeptide repeat protein [Nitrospirota bacterium]